MLADLHLDNHSAVPLYRQLYEGIRDYIDSGEIGKGDRLPATRELARKIGLNRTTVTAAYELLEAERLIERHVGRGSFVAVDRQEEAARPVRWQSLLVDDDAGGPRSPSIGGGDDLISFATSRPATDLFPLSEIRKATREVMDQYAAEILQLGSPYGYQPLRDHLIEQAREDEEARASDDIVVTSGCQQALDLLARVLIAPGDTVAVEDPLYPGLHHVLAHSGARIAGVPVGPDGLDIEHLAALLRRERPKLVIVTPNFQNPDRRHAVDGGAPSPH